MRQDILYLPPISARDLSGDITAQTREALAMADELLADAGSGREWVLIAHVWLRDMALFGEMTAVWNEWVRADALPSRSCVSRIPAHPDVLVEFDITALKPAPAQSPDTIERYGLVEGPGRPRMSLALAHEDWFTVCLVPPDSSVDAGGQAQQILDLFDGYLSAARTSRGQIQSMQVWLSRMSDFEAVKARLDPWLGERNQPAIACMRADMASPAIAVEIRLTAGR